MMLIPLLALLVYIPSSLSCDCAKYSDYKTLQEQFCEADFVISIGVLNHDDAGGDRVYDVLLEDVFKGSPVGVERRFEIMKSIQLYTYANEDKCGIILHPKEQYVVGGKIEGGKNWISICHLNYPGSGMPCARQLFLEGCKSCKIKRCGPGFCSDRPGECKYRGDMSNQRYDDACVPGPNGCSWQECDEMTIFSTKVMPAFNRRSNSLFNLPPIQNIPFHPPNRNPVFNPPQTTPHFDPMETLPSFSSPANNFPFNFQPPTPPRMLPPIMNDPKPFVNIPVVPTPRPISFQNFPPRRLTTPKWINFWLLPGHFKR